MLTAADIARLEDLTGSHGALASEYLRAFPAALATINQFARMLRRVVAANLEYENYDRDAILVAKALLARFDDADPQSAPGAK